MYAFTLRFALLAAVAILGATSIATASDIAPSPYAGQAQRAIKALSEADVADLLAGRGWGLAKPAELNGYPGPIHLIEMREAIGLSDDQMHALTGLFEDMKARARRVGAQYVDAERRLEEAFSARTVDSESLTPLVREAERLRGELRLVHLETHLRTLPLLTHHQVMTYARLRGYGKGPHDEDHGGHRH